ncbi:MAG: ThuA domain-containing protein [Solirubrobacteraceae bacterium]
MMRAVSVAALGAIVCLLIAQGSGAQTASPEFRVLVFSKTAGFRHDSIPNGIAAIRELGQQNDFAVDATEDSTQFNDTTLAGYDAVVFLSTTGDVLDEEQQGAFERYIRAGGGFVGIHAAADTEYEWPFYGELVGAYFSGHPHQQQATVDVEDGEHPATAHLPASWSRFDEWYNYKAPDDPQSGLLATDYSPRGDVHVLAALDESSYVELDGSDLTSDDHPIAWCQDYAGGRSFYTGGGHTSESFADEAFRKHLLGGIRTAAGAEPADCSASGKVPTDSDFEQVTLAKGTESAGEPISLAVLPDGDVLHTSRDGRVFYTTTAGETTIAARMPVYTHDEEGLQGVAVDPSFAENRWVYLFYAPKLDTPADDPATPGINEGDAPSNGSAEDFEPFKGQTYLSRFKLNGDTLDLASEQVILKVAADRGICCHLGGDIDFDAQGNLYLSTGDDTNPFSSDGYTPIDERPDRNPAYDAQRTSANTNDLRGKILRIHPEADGSYTIPAGNLFGPGGKYPDADPAKTRPEIYAMGFRNPFRFSVDRRTGWLYVGEYGPDAPVADPDRGPGGLVEFNQIPEPGNYGWPYCIGPNLAYDDYDFATGTSGPEFDCQAPVNESPHNTGLRELPPAEVAWIHYDGGTVTYDGRSTDEFGNGGEAPMGGPVYDFDPALQSDVKFPEYFAGHFFAGDWTRGWIKDIAVGPDGEPSGINAFFDSATIYAPMDMQFGPDGSLYVLDYGSGSYTGGNMDSAVYKINHVEGSRSPIAEASATPDSGPATLTVGFSSDGSRDPDGDEISYSWDFDGDGTDDSAGADPTHEYTQEGVYTARLTVTDTHGKTGTSTETITVGNTRPTVKIEFPASGAIFDYGDRVQFKVGVTDPEDGPIDCTKVTVDTALGHNEHAHGDQSFSGCEGTFTIPAAWEPDTQYSFYVVSASYTDAGGANGAASLTGSDQAILQPRILQAEHFASSDGVRVEEASDPAGGGGRAIGRLEDGDHVSYAPINLRDIDRLDFRVASGGLGGTIDARAGSPSGPLLGSVDVPNTGGAQSWIYVQMPVTDSGATHELFLVFRNPLVPENPLAPGSMFSVNFIEFVGAA